MSAEPPPPTYAVTCPACQHRPGGLISPACGLCLGNGVLALVVPLVADSAAAALVVAQAIRPALASWTNERCGGLGELQPLEVLLHHIDRARLHLVDLGLIEDLALPTAPTPAPSGGGHLRVVR